MNMKELQETLEKLVPTLANLGVPYHITGGLAVAYHAEPRLTQDIDIVIPKSLASRFNDITNGLLQNFHLEPVAAKRAFDTNGMFQILDEDSLVKIVIHIGESVPDELSHTTMAEILPGIIGFYAQS
jgi:hypothetical protein